MECYFIVSKLLERVAVFWEQYFKNLLTIKQA